MNSVGYVFIAILIFTLVFVFLRILTIVKNKMETEEISVPLKYIKNRFNIKIRETRAKRIRLYIDLVNTIAITVPVYIVLFVDLKMNKYLVYGLSLMLFIILVIGGYNIIGFIEKRKDEK